MTDSANAHGPYISHLGHVPIVERLVKGDWECINNKQFPVRDDTDRPSTRLRERRAQTPRPSGNVINLQRSIVRNEQLVANDAQRRVLTPLSRGVAGGVKYAAMAVAIRELRVKAPRL